MRKTTQLAISILDLTSGKNCCVHFYTEFAYSIIIPILQKRKQKIKRLNYVGDQKLLTTDLEKILTFN